MTLEVITGAYSETFAAATSWTIIHARNTLSPVIDAWSGGCPDERLMPAAVIVIDENTVRLDWSVATAGRVYVV